ncbi:MAG: hypothetical protein ACYDC3_08665 [Candidatus Binataceae bacterium]
MSSEVGLDELKKAVERMHGYSASWLKSELVRDQFQGKTVWNGSCKRSSFQGIRQRRSAPRGRRRSREARNGGSSTCSRFRQSKPLLTRFERPLSRSIVRSRTDRFAAKLGHYPPIGRARTAIGQKPEAAGEESMAPRREVVCGGTRAGSKIARVVGDEYDFFARNHFSQLARAPRVFHQEIR